MLFQNVRLRNEDLEREVEIMQKAVIAIRRLKKIFNLTRKHKSQGRENVLDAIFFL